MSIKKMMKDSLVRSLFDSKSMEQTLLENVDSIPPGSVLHAEAETERDHIIFPHAPLETRIQIEISTVTERMGVSQRDMFETHLSTFLNSELAKSSFQMMEVVKTQIMRETLTQEDMGQYVLVLDVDIVGKNTAGTGTHSDSDIFSKDVEKAINGYEEYFALDLNNLSEKDQYFKDVYGLKISDSHNVIFEESDFIPLLEPSGSYANVSLIPGENFMNVSLTPEAESFVNVSLITGGLKQAGLATFEEIVDTLLRKKTMAIIAIVSGFLGLFFLVLMSISFYKRTQSRKNKNLSEVVTIDEPKNFAKSPRRLFTLPKKKKKENLLSGFDDTNSDSFHENEKFTNSPILNKFVSPKSFKAKTGLKSEEENSLVYNRTSQSNVYEEYSAQLSHLNQRENKAKEKQITNVCFAPPGRLGVAVDAVDGSIVVHKIKPGSPLENILHPLDEIVSIDDIQTAGMTSGEVTKLMVRNIKKSRKIDYIRKENRNSIHSFV